MLKFGPFSGHFDHLARIRVLARNFGSTGSSDYMCVLLYSQLHSSSLQSNYALLTLQTTL